MLKKICNLVSEIALFRKVTSSAYTWPELVDFLFSALKSDVSRFQTIALSIFEKCPQFVASNMDPQDHDTLMSVGNKLLSFLVCSDHTKNEAAARALVNLASRLEPAARPLFTHTLAHLPKVLKDVFYKQHPKAQTHAAEILEPLLQMGDSDFFRQSGGHLVQPFFEPCLLITRTDFHYEARLLHSVLKLVASNLRPIEVDRDYVQRFYTCVLHLLSNGITSEDHLWLEDKGDEFEGPDSTYCVTKLLLHEFVAKMGFTYLADCWLARMEDNMTAADNPTKVALMVIVAQLFQGITKENVNHKAVSPLFHMSRLLLKVPNPEATDTTIRIQWAAIAALKDFGEALQRADPDSFPLFAGLVQDDLTEANGSCRNPKAILTHVLSS